MASTRSFLSRQINGPATPGQLVFDVAFGVVLPVLCFIWDPVVFTPGSDTERYELFADIGLTLATASLVVWVALGSGLSPWLEALLAGALAITAAVAFGIGMILLPLSLIGLLLLIGILGFTPFIMSFVYLRNAVRAAEAALTGLSRSRVSALVVVGIVVTLAVPAGLHLHADHTVERAMSVLEDGDLVQAKEVQKWLETIPWCPSGCAAPVRLAYFRTNNPSQRANLAAAYETLTGTDVRYTRSSFVSPEESEQPKPAEVYLELEYDGVGWSPDGKRYYFFKRLNEQRDYVWGPADSGPFRWMPETTASTVILSSVASDGSKWTEEASVPVELSGGTPDRRAVTSSGELITGLGGEIWRVGHHEPRRLATVPIEIRELDLSPDGQQLVVGDGQDGGLHLVNVDDGTVERITDGYDINPHWSPDGSGILFGRFLAPEPGHGEAILLYRVADGQVERILHGECRCGRPSAWWVDDVTIVTPQSIHTRLTRGASDIKVVSDSSGPLSYYLGPIPECIDQLSGIRTPEGPVRSYASVTRDGTRDGFVAVSFSVGVQLFRFGDPTGYPSSVQCTLLFSAVRDLITISDDASWEVEIDLARDANGELW